MANRCQFLKLGSTELCGRNCQGELCANHNLCMRRGGTHPCTGCGIGVKSKVRLCMSCGHDRVAHRVAYANNIPTLPLYEFLRLAAIDVS